MKIFLVRTTQKALPTGEVGKISCGITPNEDLTGLTREDIYKKLEALGVKGAQLPVKAGVAITFSEISIGDIILAVNTEEISVVKTVREYYFNANEHLIDARYQRTILRTELPSHLRSGLLRTPKLVANISKDKILIDALLDGTITDNMSTLTAVLPLRKNMVSFKIKYPSDISTLEVERIKTFLDSIVIEK